MVGFVLGLFDQLFHLLLLAHDQLLYIPLQRRLTPLVKRVPRTVSLGGSTLTLFTANGVTLARTVLVVFVVTCLKNQYYVTACLLVALHDFLDHLDGIVAKAQREMYGERVDDPLLGAFLDAFCDKIVNVTLLWSALVLTDYSTMSVYQFIIYLSIPGLVICSEFILGIVRVQDYYNARYAPNKGHTPSLAASIEGKLKEKLESVGLAMLCLSLSAANPVATISGQIGLTSLSLSLRFAYGSLVHKLNARTGGGGEGKPTTTITANGHIDNNSADNSQADPSTDPAVFNLSSSSSSEDEGGVFTMREESTTPTHETKVDKVYTVGCFDLFHRGHKRLLMNMRHLGRELIIGVHSDESYVKLKHKQAIDNIETRITNVKGFADQVYVVSGTNPAPFLSCAFHLREGQTALYVRGDDMPQFPGRATVESLMPVQLLPYTHGVSSTALRAERESNESSN